MTTMVLDIETITPAWNEGEHGWAPDKFPPPAYHLPVVASFLVAETRTAPPRLTLESYRFDAGSGHLCKSGEEKALHALRAQLVESARLVTFNGRAFDMPVLSIAAMRAGVPWNWWAEPAKGRKSERRARFANWKDASGYPWHVDLADQVGDHACNIGGLDALAHALGLAGKSGHGSDVAAQYAAGEWDSICRYCEDDVIQTWLVYLRWIKAFLCIDVDALEQATADLVGREQAPGKI